MSRVAAASPSAPPAAPASGAGAGEVPITDWRQIACGLIEAEQKSRSRLAERLHGELQQLLTVALMRTWAAKRLSNQEEMLAVLSEVEAVVRESIEETRTLTLDLCPPILRHSAFSKAMEWIAERMAELHGMKVELAIHPEADTAMAEIKSFLFDAIRSLLLHYASVAGDQFAKVAVTRSADRIRVEIDFPQRVGTTTPSFVERNGHDLPLTPQQIKDRVRVLGGQVSIQTTCEGGERIVMILPGDSCEARADSPAGSDLHRSKLNGEGAQRPTESPAGVIRILLVEDHQMVREGLARLINSEPDFCVVGEAADGQMAVEMAASLNPDVVVLDVNMPIRTGPEAARGIKLQSPQVKIVGLSEYGDRVTRRAMRDAGANAYLCKDSASEELCRTIRQAVCGNGHSRKQVARKDAPSPT